MASGMKITEVDQTTATVWTRLTEQPGQHRRGAHFGKRDETLPAGKQLGDMILSAAGNQGEVRVRYWAKGSDESKATDWEPVIASADFIRHFQLTGLLPGTEYVVKAEGRPSKGSGRAQ